MKPKTKSKTAPKKASRENESLKLISELGEELCLLKMKIEALDNEIAKSKKEDNEKLLLVAQANTMKFYFNILLLRANNTKAVLNG